MKRWKAAARWSTVCLLGLVCANGVLAGELSERCLECHSQVAMELLPLQFENGEEASTYIERDTYLESAHGHLTCDECHRQRHPEFRSEFAIPTAPRRKPPSRRAYALAMDLECRRCHEAGGEGAAKHVANVLHSAGGDETPLCADCHLPHEMKAAADTVAGRDPALDHVCARCHQDLYTTFVDSVHGAALGETPNPDAPSCTSCHLGHEGGGKSFAARRVRAGRPCMGCHGDEEMMRKYDISTAVVGTYLDDFHGVSVKFYGDDAYDSPRNAMVCADCHGIHDIASADGNAVAMKTRMADACRKCHPDATENFTGAWLSHTEPSLSTNILVFAVKVSYCLLIPFVIGGLILHILFDLVVAPIRARLAEKRGLSIPSPHLAIDGSPDIPKYFVRFSRRQRAEHFLVLVTFVILCATGLPQRFHDSAWSMEIVRLLGGIDSVRIIHRIAGYGYTIVAVFHFVYVLGSIVLRRTKMTMVPTQKDFLDAIGSPMYHLGLTDKFPKADRFDYQQKFEYWGMLVGTVIMVGSGFALMFPTVLTQLYIPGQVLALARVVHSYEAMMALLTIVIWHMYGARFNPVIFTGKISAKYLASHHPLEYERLVSEIHQTRVPKTHVRPCATAAGHQPAGETRGATRSVGTRVTLEGLVKGDRPTY